MAFTALICCLVIGDSFAQAQQNRPRNRPKPQSGSGRRPTPSVSPGPADVPAAFALENSVRRGNAPGGKEKKDRANEKKSKGTNKKLIHGSANGNGQGTGRLIGEAEPLGFVNEPDVIANAISFGGSFAGFADTGSFPPDPTMAAGPHNVVIMVNRNINIISKNGTPVPNKSQTLASFFASLGSVATDPMFDPKAIYDRYLNRFWVLAVSRNGAVNPVRSQMAIGLSNTDDAADGFSLFVLDMTQDGGNASSNWCDYPQIGLDAQAIYLTCNMFDFSNPANFQYAKVRIMTKSQFVNNACCLWWDFWNLREDALGITASFTLQPAHMKNAAVGDGAFLINSHTFCVFCPPDTLEVRRIRNAQRCCIPGNQTEPDLDEESHDVGEFDTPPDAEAQNSGTNIDTGDTRLLYAFWKNGRLSTGQGLACNDGDDACISFTELDVSGYPDDISTINDFAYQTAGINFYYPQVDVNDNEDKTMVFSSSSGSRFADARFIGIPSSLTCTNCVDGPETVLQAGAAGYVRLDMAGRNRWGDYSGASVDPAGTGIWIHGEFASSTANQWGTSVGLSRMSLDVTAPVTTSSLSPPPTGGWNNSDVTVTLNATDNGGGSGVRRITYSASGAQVINSTTVNGSSTNFLIFASGITTVSFFAEDNWGNIESTKNVVVRIDRTPPSVSCGSADGLWHANNVSIGCTSFDSGGSGLANPSDAAFSLSTTVPAGVETANASTGTRMVCDVAGNCTTGGPIGGNMIDRKAPTITINVPANVVYILNQAVPSNYACADGGSGVATCAGPVANGSNIDTSSVGTKSFMVQATDAVGNASNQSVTYTVTFAICLEYDPTKASPAGGTATIRLKLCDANSVSVGSESIQVQATSVSPSGALQSPGNNNPGGVFKFSNGGSYQFLLSTKGYAPGSYNLNFTAQGDPITHQAPFLLK